MSAYMVAIRTQCDTNGCRSRATVEVFNTVNASQGKFCQRHGMQRLADLRRHEAKAIQSIMGDRGGGFDG